MSTDVWRFEHFELDPSAYRLSCNGQIVRLERIPLELLLLLVERCGQTVTRDEIRERVWGKGVFIDSENAIDTAVRKIRRALADDADAPRFIITIPAKGYRFIAPIMVANGELEITANLFRSAMEMNLNPRQLSRLSQPPQLGQAIPNSPSPGEHFHSLLARWR